LFEVWASFLADTKLAARITVFELVARLIADFSNGYCGHHCVAITTRRLNAEAGQNE